MLLKFNRHLTIDLPISKVIDSKKVIGLLKEYYSYYFNIFNSHYYSDFFRNQLAWLNPIGCWQLEGVVGVTLENTIQLILIDSLWALFFLGIHVYYRCFPVWMSDWIGKSFSYKVLVFLCSLWYWWFLLTVYWGNK